MATFLTISLSLKEPTPMIGCITGRVGYGVGKLTRTHTQMPSTYAHDRPSRSRACMSELKACAEENLFLLFFLTRGTMREPNVELTLLFFFFECKIDNAMYECKQMIKQILQLNKC